MDKRIKAYGAKWGIALALLLGVMKTGAAQAQAKPSGAPAAATEAKAQAAGEDKKALKERGSETAAPLVERNETPEVKAKRLNYAKAMKATRAATAKMDAAYAKAVVAREQARLAAEKSAYPRLDAPAEGGAAK